jgi:molybdopterin-guanine dinucleotide biosynthesis protein A
VTVHALGAIVLAGGGGRRLGGRDKPALPVGGRPMLARVLDAVASAAPRVVVGPDRDDLPADIVQRREDPPGGGPVAAVAAGLAAVETALGGAAADPPRAGDPAGLVAVLAADLPFLSAAAVDGLAGAVAGPVDLAVLVDDDGREQWLCAVWRVSVLRARIADLAPVEGRSMRRLVSGLRVARVGGPTGAPPAWYDCDTEDDYRRAEEWQRERAGRVGGDGTGGARPG